MRIGIATTKVGEMEVVRKRLVAGLATGTVPLS